MADIKIALVIDDENPVAGDLYLERGTPRLTKGLLEEVAQDIRNSLGLFKGEWFLDPRQGMPYWQSIIGQRTSLGIIEQIFKRAILQRPGVKSLPKFIIRRVPTRQLDVIFNALLKDGQLLVSSSYAPFLVGG